MFASLLPSLRMLIVLSALTGVVYPLVTWGIAQVAFPARRQRQPDRAKRQGRRVDADRAAVRRSEVFLEPAVGDFAAAVQRRASSGSNQGPRNPALADAVKDRIKALRDADPGNTAAVPADLVTASASGLDPDISIAAADYQVARVAKARGMPVDAVRGLVDKYAQGRTFGILGEPRVNVVALNLALDGAAK